MLGTIEDLNKDIEKFQKNIAASNELYELLDQLIKGVNLQNEELGNRADAVIRQLNSLPGEIKDSNSQSNADIRQGIQKISDSTVASLSKAQQDYINSIAQLHNEVKQYVLNVEEVTRNIQELPEVINKDHHQLNVTQQEEIGRLLTKAEDNIDEEQTKYISELQKTRNTIDGCQKELKGTYDDFLQTLENTNIAHIHEQNLQLQKTLNKRTTLLTVISLITVAVSIIGWFI